MRTALYTSLSRLLVRSREEVQRYTSLPHVSPPEHMPRLVLVAAAALAGEPLSRPLWCSASSGSRISVVAESVRLRCWILIFALLPLSFLRPMLERVPLHRTQLSFFLASADWFSKTNALRSVSFASPSLLRSSVS
jgi:hypothetical protein